MGLLSRVHASRSHWEGPFNLKDPELAKIFSAGTRSIAGPVVNETTAFMYSPVFDAVNQISSDVAKLPLNLLKRRKEGGSDHFTDSKLYKLFKHSPNPEMRSMVFRRTITTHALIHGGGFAEIDRDKVGRPAALWIIEPDRIEPFYDFVKNAADGRKKPLRYRVDGEKVFDASDILHIQGLGWDGTLGFEMVQIARQAIGLGLAAEGFASAFFSNGTRFGGVLSSDQDLDDDQALEIQKKIENLHARADKAFRLLVLGAGFKFESAGTKPNEAQMKEIRDQQVQEIARFFNIPLHKLKNLDRATNNNIEHQDLEYYKGCILNWITLWEEELNAKLISPLEQGSQYFKHNANAFLRGAIKDRYEALGIARDKGIINADEWRELEDQNPQEGGQGKLYLVQSAQIPLNKLEEMADATITKTKQPPPAPVAPSSKSDSDAERAALLSRAEAAEQAKQEALTQAAEIRDRVVALEATGTATAAELQAVRESESKALTLAATLTEIAETRRAEHAAVQAAHDALAVNLEAQKRAADEAGAAAVDAMARADLMAEAAEAARAQLAAESAKATARAADAEQRAIDAISQAEAARAEMMDKAREYIRTESEASKLELEEAKRELQAAVNLELQFRAHAEAREAQAAEARAKLAEAEAAIAAREDTHKAELERVRAELATMEQSLAEARKAHAELKVKAHDTEQARLAAESEAKAQRVAEVERMTATIAAHRGLIVDALGRMTRRECEQARAKQATPEKLRRWLDHFASVHEAICVEALTPAIRAHLAWTRSGDDPVAVTTALVREHIETFTAKVRSVLDVDREDFHAVLERTLTRWETERAGQVADALLIEEIKNVRQ